jgi:hypothetical protein
MKNIFLLLLVLTLAASCKKKYNCACTTTYTYNNGQNIFDSKNTAMSAKMTQKQAKAVCDHEAEDINETHINYVTNSGNYSSNGQNFTTTCTLD